MNDLAAPFRQLVERRLWPLALILVAALAAVFLLLSEGEEPVPAGPTAASTAAKAAAAATTPIVSLGTPEAREAHRKVLGARKNPFEPTVKAKKADDVTTTSTAAPRPADPGTGTSGGGPVSVGGVTSPGVPVTPTEEPKVYELYSLWIRFGESSDAKLTGVRNLKRLKALPNAIEPVVIYLGLLEDRKTAVFLVDAGVKVQGDGRCHPEPANCQTLHLKRGETSFFDVLDEAGNTTAQYQLDLVKIRTSKTMSAASARAARSAEADGGRDALRARTARVGNLRYDSRSGVVRNAK